MNKRLENGQPVALRFATDGQETEFPGVIQSLDRTRGLISLKMDGQMDMEMPFLAGKKVTIVGRARDFDLDVPGVVVDGSRFPILVCRWVDRRDHLRVNTFLHLTYRPVDREIYENDPEGLLLRVQEEMGTGESPFESLRDELDPETLSPKLLALLETMNQKMDRILSRLEGQGGESRGVIPVNISGSGLRFVTREKMEVGQLLAIRIVLPFSPPAIVVFVSEVRRVREKEKGEFEIAVKSVAIAEADQEKIVHYAFKRMRESIRSRRKTVQT